MPKFHITAYGLLTFGLACFNLHIPCEIFSADRLPVLPIDTLPDTLELNAQPTSIKNQRVIPADNPLTAEKVALGRKLFFDPILSKDKTVSCASCHQPDHGFASPDKLAVGIGGQVGDRNAPTLLNRVYGTKFFWDGRVDSLEEQALKPIANPKELGTNVDAVIVKLSNDPKYTQQFHEAFPTIEQPVTSRNMAKALAAFQRTLIASDSPIDEFQAGKYSALNRQQRKGLWLFESRAACWKCHSGDNYSDEDFHNTGIGFDLSERDLGRFMVTKNKKDKGKFKTPTLREVSKTAPYMHNGSLTTLRDVVEFYNRGGEVEDPNLDPELKPLGLTDDEVEALVELLKVL